MRAKIRRFSAGSWTTVAVSTEPLRVELLEGTQEDEGFDSSRWIETLPPTRVAGKSTRFLEDPEGWLTTMGRMTYTRITVEIL